MILINCRAEEVQNIHTFIPKVKRNDNTEFSMKAFPLWWRKYSLLFSGQYEIETHRIDREMWAVYMSQEIECTERRLYSCLGWPFLPEEHRKKILTTLHDVSLKEVDFKSFFKSQVEQKKGTPPLYICLKNSRDNKPSLSSQFLWNDGFSFIIIDNSLIFEPQTRPYHHFRKIFKISYIQESILLNLFPEVFC